MAFIPSLPASLLANAKQSVTEAAAQVFMNHLPAGGGVIAERLPSPFN